MATARPFAYNPGPSIPGTSQIGNLSIGAPTSGFTNNPQYWNGPNEELGYVIAQPVSGNTQPTQVPKDAITLSSTYKGTDVNLSNNNQTATQQFGYQQSVLGETIISGTNKVMFSVLCNLLEPNTLVDSHFIGVGTTSMNYQGNPYGGYPGNDTQSIGFNAIGQYYYNGSVVASGLPTWTDGDTIDIAISHGQYWWIRVNGGNWNNNPSADPTTLTNGLTTTGLTNYYPTLCPAYQGIMTVLNYPKYGVPSDYNFLGNVSASVGFFRSPLLTENSFVEYTNSLFGQSFTGGTDAATWLNANGYWTSYIPKRPFSELQTIAEYLRNYMPEFRNPSFYPYWLDGDGYEISDGGGDMYDDGNISSPWIVANTEYVGTDGYSPGNYPFAVDYTQSATTQTLDTSFGYISLGYQQYTGTQSLTYLPLTVLGARDNETYGPNLPIGFQTGGNSGADGSGTLASATIYSGETVSGFTVYSFFRETYNAGDPSHCDLYILLGHPNWNSTFGTVSSFAQPTNVGGCGGYLYTTGAGTQNILAIKTLLSKNGGQLVTQAECQTVVNNFIIRIKQSQSF